MTTGTQRTLGVVGANGRTGGRVVVQAMDRGYEVVAIARAPVPPLTKTPGIQVRDADALDADAIRDGLAGCNAVISALGAGTSRDPTLIYSEGVRNLLLAMESHGADRIVVVSAAPVGPASLHPPLQRRLVLPILKRILGEQYTDMRRMEALLAASEVDWASLRPPRLVERPGRGEYRLNVDAPVRGGNSLSCDDLATALLDALDNPDLTRTAAYVAN